MSSCFLLLLLYCFVCFEVCVGQTGREDLTAVSTGHVFIVRLTAKNLKQNEAQSARAESTHTHTHSPRMCL